MKPQKQRGNEMKRVKLSATGLEFEVQDGFHYHDDGLVPNMREHSKKLDEMYGEFHTSDFDDNPSADGRYRILFDKPYPSVEDTLNNGGKVDAHIYVSQGHSELITAFYKGHEETHILLHLNKLELLKAALKDRRISADTMEQEQEEVICHIGGFLSMMNLMPGERMFNFDGDDYSIYRVKEWVEQHSDIRFEKE